MGVRLVEHERNGWNRRGGYGRINCMNRAVLLRLRDFYLIDEAETDMIVFLRFVAFSSQKSNRITPFSLPDRSTMEGLLNAIQENWKETGTGTEDEQNSLRDQTIFASNGRMLLPDEPLTEGQQISVIGPILGG